MRTFTIGKPVEYRPGKWRCLINFSGHRAWGPTKATADEAQRGAERAAQEAVSGALTVREAISAFLQHMRTNGARERSIQTAGHQVHRFFAPVMEISVAELSASRAARLYEELRTLRSGRGRPLAVATQQECLARAKAFCSWSVEAKLLRHSPLADVKPVGVASRGKYQLRLDEARRLVQVCLGHAEHDDGALAVLLALLLGMRGGEIVSRTVRDLDDGGRMLWIDDTASGWQTKSRASKRRVELPALLQPLLRQRIAGKPASAPLFHAARTPRGTHAVNWVRENTARFCRAAGVPVVCSHALRGQHATIALRAGATPHLVAGALGHESPQTTLAAYAEPGSAQEAATRFAEQSLLN